MNKLLCALILVLGVQAHAHVLFEPFVGYDQSKLSLTNNSTGDASYTNSGMDYGARLGYRFMGGFWIAAEYAAGSGTSKSGDTGGTNMDYSKSAVSAVIGFHVHRLRFWAGYGFSDKMTAKQSGVSNVDYTGTNIKVGVGYHLGLHTSLNFEYLMPKYTKMAQDGVSTDVSSQYSKFDTSGMMLSLSFPL